MYVLLLAAILHAAATIAVGLTSHNASGFNASGTVFRKASERATLAYRGYLARQFGHNSEREREFSAALVEDGALVVGSSVLAHGLIPTCSWVAKDLDVWIPFDEATVPFAHVKAFLRKSAVELALEHTGARNKSLSEVTRVVTAAEPELRTRNPIVESIVFTPGRPPVSMHLYRATLFSMAVSEKCIHWHVFTRVLPPSPHLVNIATLFTTLSFLCMLPCPPARAYLGTRT
jgi:hypothetical protein